MIKNAKDYSLKKCPDLLLHKSKSAQINFKLFKFYYFLEKLVNHANVHEKHMPSTNSRRPRCMSVWASRWSRLPNLAWSRAISATLGCRLAYVPHRASTATSNSCPSIRCRKSARKERAIVSNKLPISCLSKTYHYSTASTWRSNMRPHSRIS